MSVNLVLLRHGQSEWNLENRFTGWVDVDLTALGIEEATNAGRVLREQQFKFDFALTSLLKRSIRTLWITLDEIDQMWLPVRNDWELNERHYGALQGLNKREMAKLHGAEQVHTWRRSYKIRPPKMSEKQLKVFADDVRYEHLTEIPKSESLEDTYHRVVRYWDQVISKELALGKRLIIVAHGNSLRALVKYLDNISDEEITSLNIPTGIPLVYQLNDQLRPVHHYYLADSDTIEKATAEVVNQGATE